VVRDVGVPVALRRPYILAQYLYLPAPVGGWNPDAHPWEMPDNQAYQLDNLIPRPGKVVMRGGIKPMYDTSGLTPPLRAMSFPNGPSQVGGAGAVWTWISRAATLGVDAADAAWAGGASTVASTSTIQDSGTHTPIVVGMASRDAVPGPRWVHFDGLLYVLGFDSASAAIQDTNATYSIPPTKLMTIPSIWATGVTSMSPTLLTLAPQGAIDLTTYQNRLWLLGGADTPGGSTVHNANTLYFTIPGGSGIGALTADWRDPVTAETNFITVDNDLSDTAVGLARVRNGLLIFRHNSVYIMRGSTETSYQISKVSSEVGCIDQRSILETDSGVYFLSLKGLMLTDGISIQNVSGPLRNTLSAACRTARGVALPPFPLNTGPGYATCALLPGGSIVVSIGQRSSVYSPGNILTLFSAVLDRQTNTWWRFTSNVFSTEQSNQTGNQYPGMVFSAGSPSIAVSLGNSKVMDLTQIENYGAEPTLFGYDSDSNGGGAHLHGIPAIWVTKMLPTTSTSGRTKHTSKHLYLDYAFGMQGITPARAWQVQVMDASMTSIGVPLNTAQSFGSSTSGWVSFVSESTVPAIQRQGQDMIFDVADSWLQVAFNDATVQSGSGPSSAVLELYGAGISILPGPNEPLT
jgi:hypothetical protein